MPASPAWTPLRVPSPTRTFRARSVRAGHLFLVKAELSPRYLYKRPVYLCDLHYFVNRNSKPMPSCDISPFANRLWDTMASMASLLYALFNNIARHVHLVIFAFHA